MEYDFSDWLNEIISKHPSENQQEYYNRLIAMRIRLDIQLSEKRCVSCCHYEQNKCNNYNHVLLDEQCYEVHDCKAHTDRIPF